MTDLRAFHTATLLVDGTVLLAGGAKDSAGSLSNTADIYNPITDKFSATTGNLSDHVGGHAAVALTAGTSMDHVLIIGGIVDPVGLTATPDVEDYNPVTKMFSSTTQMQDPRAFPSATVLADGERVLIAGGFLNFSVTISGKTLESTFGNESNSAEIFDATGPSAPTSTCVAATKPGASICKASMKLARGGHAAALLGDGTVLIAGGLGGPKVFTTSKPLNEAEVFSFSSDPTMGTFTKVGNMKAARGFAAAAVVP